MVPDDASTVEEVVAAISQQPQGDALMVVGDFNTDLSALEGRVRDEEITADMAESGLEDMIRHFFPLNKP